MSAPSNNEPDPNIPTGKSDGEEPSHPGVMATKSAPDEESLAIANIVNPDASQVIYGEDDDSDPRSMWEIITQLTPKAWLIVASIILFGIGIWAAATLLNDQAEVILVKQKELPTGLEKEEQNKTEHKKILRSMKESVRGYLTADSIDEILPFVRHEHRVKPLMERYYSQHSFQPAEFVKFQRIRSMGLENQPFAYINVSLKDGQSRKLLIEELANGAFRVDWETDVCYQPIEWNKLIKTRPSQAVDMRVKITPDNFYAYEFKDESRFQCYRITTRDSDEHLFGYAIKNSPTNRKISQLLLKSSQYGGSKSEPMILRLSFPEKTNSKKCVWIDALLAPRWTYVTDVVPDTSASK